MQLRRSAINPPIGSARIGIQSAAVKLHLDASNTHKIQASSILLQHTP
ncbi:hypothetical protein SynWH8101_1728 [Synechococcus sp. WH 8101]|nr:hypothetical protein SynWH8101_1728 [Synechococcus sp. WH 8101]QNI45549.1 hypothetical protein SynRCC2555_01769 [Synechococcus sp. WH 8101]